MKWIKIYPKPDSSDFIVKVKAEGKSLCLIQYRGQLAATQIRCPHAGADLSGGWCKNGKLICPYHRYQYDLLTGRGAEGQGDYIKIYPTELREDGVYIGLKEKWTFFKNIFRL